MTTRRVAGKGAAAVRAKTKDKVAAKGSAKQKAGGRSATSRSASSKSTAPRKGVVRSGSSSKTVHTSPRMDPIAVDVAVDKTVVPLSQARVKEIVHGVCKSEGVDQAMISLTFVSDRKIAQINREFLDHDGSTDIITFELKPVRGVIIGDIYIAPSVARRNARLHETTLREELIRLIVHGTLHVLGYTHPESERRMTSPMWRKQEKLVADFA